VPLYFQLAATIRAQIQAGTLAAGQQLPAERDLAREAGISRMTARQALAELAHAGDIVVRHGIGNLAVGTSISYDIAANWKLVVENFMECYHCAPVHPELTRLLPEFRFGTSYQGIVGKGTDFASDIEGFTLSGNGKRDMLPGLLPSDDRLYYGFVIWPNLFVNLLPDHVILHTLLPTGPETSRVVCDWLFTPSEIAKPDFDPKDTVDVFDITNRQDWDVCERTQLGMRSRAYDHGGFYVTNEQHIAVFRDLVLERLGEKV
jgi:Rieske 2Fe-2S family protein